MKYLLINVLFFFALTITSCATPTPVSTQVISDLKTEKDVLILAPVQKTMLESIYIEFLIDNSNSVESESNGGCGKRLGEKRFDFVRFITGAFRDAIPANYLQNLYVGVSTFDSQYRSLLSPTSMDNIFSIPNPGQPTSTTRYTIGIQGALKEIDSTNKILQKQNRYLIIITDGETETESVENVESEIKKYKDPNLHIYTALLCDKNSRVWFDTIDPLDIADTFVGLENLAKRLFDDLGKVFSVDGQLILPDKESSIQISGDTISVNFSYWSSENDPSNYLKINGPSETKSLISFETYSYNNLYPLPECSYHTFIIEPPSSSNWFLFVHPEKFQKFMVSMNSSNGRVTEIVNDVPLNFQLEAQDLLYGKDLSKWKDCFSAQLIWSTINQNNQENKGELNFASCESMNFLCFTKEQWSPQFTDIGNVEVEVKLESLDGTVWESETNILPIKFRVEYDNFNSTPYILNEELKIGKKDFTFKDVPPASLADVYLVSSTGDLDNNSCPNLTHTINGLKARKLAPMPIAQCDFSYLSDASEGNRVCISYSSHGSLSYIYSLIIYDRIAKTDCQYDQLYFKWYSDAHSIEMGWWCSFLENKECVPDESKLIVKPFL